MPANSFEQWQALTPYGVTTGGEGVGSASNTLPRGTGPLPWWRDPLDAKRSGWWYRTPDAEYPSGYLSTFHTRRDSRLTGGPPPRINQKRYDRGVHFGVRVPPEEYFWNDDIHPMKGLELQAQGKKFAPLGELHTHLINDGKAGPVRGSQSLASIQPALRTTPEERKTYYQQYRTPWS